MTFSEEIRERVQNMAIYFVDNTEQVDELKLDKLFFFADEAACKAHGIGISEQTYLARKNGPVPVSAAGREALFSAFDLGSVLEKTPSGFYAKTPGRNFNQNIFTPRQLQCLRAIADKYRDVSGSEMSSHSHGATGAWQKAWQDGNGDGKEIDISGESDMSPETVGKRQLFRERLALSRQAFSALES